MPWKTSPEDYWGVLGLNEFGYNYGILYIIKKHLLFQWAGNFFKY
jgi:hypothetical protein